MKWPEEERQGSLERTKIKRTETLRRRNRMDHNYRKEEKLSKNMKNNEDLKMKIKLRETK